MHSLLYLSLALATGASARVLPPTITPAPALVEERDEPDAASLALVLITAVPEEIREVAATNIAAASSILWSEFLGGNRPSWFTDLPEDIQVYLVDTFGPKTAAPSALPTILPSLTDSPASSTFDDGQWHPSTSVASSHASATGSPATESQRASTTNSADRNQTTETGTISQTASASRSSRSSLPTSGLTLSTQKTAPSVASTSTPPAPTSAEQDGLTRGQKIGIGLGVPLGIAGAAVLFLACCFLLRRRQRKNVHGSVPPSSPGFIPRFSFQEKMSHNDIENRPLTRRSDSYQQDWGNSAWDDDGIDPTAGHPLDQNNIQHQQWPVSHYQPDPPPVLAPLLHTHSSNKARGKRTSYSSLHSVAEVSEPDEVESPVLGRDLTPRHSPARQSAARRPSVTIPPIPEAVQQVRRKPISSPPSQSPAAEVASQTLWRQTMGQQSHNPNRYGNQTSVTAAASPVTPTERRGSQSPLNNHEYSYVEDYGPEYPGAYVDAVENDMFGGHTSLSRYPEPKTSKTDWPLKNSLRHKRTRSPMWDRVYDG